MTLEQQVCSLELAKRLKELGVKQESAFWWIENVLVVETAIGFYSTNGAGMNLHPQFGAKVSAFTVAELGEDHNVGSVFNENWGRWKGFSPLTEVACFGDTEADARAKMRIYLLENNLITV